MRSLKDTSTVMKNLPVPMDRRSRDNNRTSPGVNGASFGLTRSASSTSVASGHSGFQHQRHQLKQMRRQTKVITGNVTSSKTFRGAPEPDRQLFIQRVRKEVTETDVKAYLVAKDFTVRDLVRMSHDDAKYNSFKLTVPVTEFEKLLEPDVWPSGVRIRRFREKQNSDNPRI